MKRLRVIALGLLILLSAFPTWALTRLFTRFLPKTHPWYKRKFTYMDWATKRTELTEMFDLMLWSSGICAVIFLFYYFKHLR